MQFLPLTFTQPVTCLLAELSPGPDGGPDGRALPQPGPVSPHAVVPVPPQGIVVALQEQVGAARRCRPHQIVHAAPQRPGYEIEICI